MRSVGVGNWKLGVYVAALLCAAAAVSAQRPVRSAQQILEQLERDWVEALQRNDVDFVNNVLAPEFVSTYGDGSRGDRARELQLVKEFNQQVDKWTVDEFTVRVFNETAVVWFTQRMTGPVQGKPTEIVTRYMDVFVNRDGKWLCIGSQSTKVTAK
jgi:ketosteroid isomerase-like protein